MYEIGQIIEYIDATLDENLTNAIKWSAKNNAYVEEDISKRNKVTIEVEKESEFSKQDEFGNVKFVTKKIKTPVTQLHRFFVIKENPKISFEETKVEAPKEDKLLTKRQERDFIMCEISDKVDRYRNQKEINIKTTDSKETYIKYLEYMEYLRNITKDVKFPNVEILKFEEWVNR